jgi:hypothetical protein
MAQAGGQVSPRMTRPAPRPALPKRHYLYNLRKFDLASTPTGLGLPRGVVKSISLSYCLLRFGLFLVITVFSLYQILLMKRGDVQEVPS